MSEETEVKPKARAKSEPDEVRVSPKSAYPKEQLIQSARFAATDRDILAVVLEDGRKYTLDEIEAALQGFKNREVN